MPVFAGSSTARRQYSRNWDYVKLPRKKDAEKDPDVAKERVVFTPIDGALHKALFGPWLKAAPSDPRFQERLSTLSHWSEGLGKSIPCLMEQKAELSASGEVHIKYLDGEANRCNKVRLKWGGKRLHDLVNDYGQPNEQCHCRVWLWSANPPDDPELRDMLMGSAVLKAAVEAGTVPNYGRPAIMRVRSSIYNHLPKCSNDPDRMDACDYSWVIRLAQPADNLGRSTYYINNLDSKFAVTEEYGGRVWALPAACSQVLRKVLADDSERGFLNAYVPDDEDDIEAQSDAVVALLQELDVLACSSCGTAIPKTVSLASINWAVGPVCPNGCAASTKAGITIADIGIEAPGGTDDPFAAAAAQASAGPGETKAPTDTDDPFAALDTGVALPGLSG